MQFYQKPRSIPTLILVSIIKISPGNIEDVTIVGKQFPKWINIYYQQTKRILDFYLTIQLFVKSSQVINRNFV